MISYFNRIAGLNFESVTKIFDKNSHELKNLARKVGLKTKGNLDIETEDHYGVFDKVEVTTYDHDLGCCSVNITLAKGNPLPFLMLPYKHVFVPTSVKLQKSGVRKWVPSICLESMIEDHKDERIEQNKTGLVAPQTLAARWGNRHYKILPDNSLDAVLTAVYLCDVAAPTLRYAEDRNITLP